MKRVKRIVYALLVAVMLFTPILSIGEGSQKGYSLDFFFRENRIEKDEPFRLYKTVYDDFLSAGKRGAYGSVAFQEGAKALFDKNKIKEFGTDGAKLYKYARKQFKELYADADSMGSGILGLIIKNGEKSKDVRGQYCIKNKKGVIVASYNTKTHEWFVDDDFNNMTYLASVLGMSPGSVASCVLAMATMDPNADVSGVDSWLELLSNA